MSEEKKDLSHYLNNPDALGDLDDADLDALAGNQVQATADETQAETKGDTESAATPGDTAGEQTKGDEQQPDGILARDGKHVIPFSRLEAAEQKARDLAAEVERLTAKVASGKQEGEGGTTEAKTDGFLSDEELTELEADLPALAKVIRAQQSVVKNLSDQVATLSQDHQTQKQAQESEAEKSWKETLLKNDKAAYLDATLAPEVGQKFINAAAALHDDWATMSNEARADAIVRQYEAVHGEVKVKGIAKTEQQAPATPAAKPDAKPVVPVSMSGIPGGTAPAVDEAAAMLSKTGAELTADFMNMTPEQIEAQLNRI